MTLTREAIEAASGRELDALCAQFVMGWTALVNRGHYYDGFAPNVENSVFNIAVVPAYSTSGDAVLLVLERMRELNFYWQLGAIIQDRHSAHFGSLESDLNDDSEDPDATEVIAYTLPEAVCRAALLAILSQKSSA